MGFMDQYVDSGMIEEDVTLTNARFEIGEPSDFGTVIWLYVDVSSVDGNFEDTDVRWRVGDIEKWGLSEDETHVENIGSPGKWFHAQSQMARLMTAINGVEGLSDLLQKRVESGKVTGPDDCGFYDNLVVTFGVDTKVYKIDGEEVTSHIQVPVAFIREHGQKKAAKKATSSKTGEFGLTTAQRKAFDKLADECDDMDEFAVRAYAEITGIEDSDEMQAFVDEHAASVYE